MVIKIRILIVRNVKSISQTDLNYSHIRKQASKAGHVHKIEILTCGYRNTAGRKQLGEMVDKFDPKGPE